MGNIILVHRTMESCGSWRKFKTIMKKSILFIALFANFFLNGQVISENINESDNNDSNKLETRKTQFEFLQASLVLFGNEVVLKGNNKYGIVSLFLEIQKPNSINTNCSNTMKFHTNELGEREQVYSESKLELPYLIQVPSGVDEEFLKLRIDELEIDSIYYSEFLLTNGEKCFESYIKNKSISQLNLIINDIAKNFISEYYIIIKHFTFYRNEDLVEIPEIIGVLVR